MPRRLTLGTLVTRGQRRCDLEHDANIVSAEWKAMFSEVYGVLAASVSETGLRYFETTADITTTGVASYDEPAAHLFTVNVRRVYADGRQRLLKELMAAEEPMWAGRTGDARYFSHPDDQIVLYPTPASGQTYRVTYVYQPPEFSGEDDDYVVDTVTPDGEAFLVWGVAVIALHKHGRDNSGAKAERDRALTKVVDWATLKHIESLRRPVAVDDLYDSGALPGDWDY